jgi:ankyrin repeat protein
MKADVNIEDWEGLKPLHETAFDVNLDIVAALIKAGSEVDRKIDVVGGHCIWQ